MYALDGGWSKASVVTINWTRHGIQNSEDESQKMGRTRARIIARKLFANRDIIFVSVLISVARRDDKKRQTLVHQNGLGPGEPSHVAVRPIMASSGSALKPVPQTHVRLILLDGAGSPFYLEIPTAVINP